MLFYRVPFGKNWIWNVVSSLCHVHSGFMSTALGLADVVLYFNMK